MTDNECFIFWKISNLFGKGEKIMRREKRSKESEFEKTTEGKDSRRLADLFLKNYPNNSRFAEAYRTLRTNIHFSFMEKEFRSLLVTSAGAKEGKTNTVANMGYTLSQAGKSVLMVDADLRKPMLTNLVPSKKSPGVTGIISALSEPDIQNEMAGGEEDMPLFQEKLDSAILEVCDNLFLLPSGKHPPNPSEIMGSKGMSFLISYLKKKYDIVIIDTPPILPASDAILLAPQTDGVVLMVKAGLLSRALIKKAVEQLWLAKANLLGIVLNRLDIKKEGYYNKYYQKYYSGYYGKKYK